MKKLVVYFLFIFVLLSCNLDDEPSSVDVALPIESVVFPVGSVLVNEVSPIKIFYRRPTTCHLYNGFYYEIDSFTRKVAVRAVKLNENNCENALEEGPFEVSLNFKPTEIGTYHFKIWTGTDANNVANYIEQDIEVTN